MTNPSVTHTFTAATTASASQVNTNFTDIINSLTDGTKSLSIDALTCAGATTLNGNVTLGNASGDDITITGSLAATIPIKTNNSFNIGAATLALAGIYLGAPSSRSTRITAHQSLGASNTLVLPNGNGTSRYYPETDGSGNLTFVKPKRSPMDLHEYGFSDAVAANALTATLKGADGATLSSTNPVNFVFRNATAATGTPTELEITADLTLTVSSGSTLGFLSGATHYLYWYVANDGGTARLAVSQSYFDEGELASSTAEGGGGAADSGTILYSGTAFTSKAIRLLRRTKHSLTTAGTWDEVPDESSLIPFKKKVVSCKYGNSSTALSGTPATIVWATKDHDNHNIMNTSTGVITCPIAGKLTALVCTLISGTFILNNSMDTYVRVNSSSKAQNQKYAGGAISRFEATIPVTLDVAAGDTVDVQIGNDGTGPAFINSATANYFSVVINGW